MRQRHFKLWMIILAVLLPCGAFAAETSTWDITPGSGAGDCVFKAGHSACYADLDTASESTPTLDTRICENWTATWVSNIAATSHDNDVTVRWSISPTASVNTSGIIDNITLTGDPATARDRIVGTDAIFAYAALTTYVTGTGRLAIQCFRQAE
jgi:hypothetical protein